VTEQELDAIEAGLKEARAIGGEVDPDPSLRLIAEVRRLRDELALFDSMIDAGLSAHHEKGLLTLGLCELCGVLNQMKRDIGETLSEGAGTKAKG